MVSLPGFDGNPPYQYWLFLALAVASEVVPFVASRFQRRLLPVFMSVCFSFGVLLIWGIGPAVVVQTVAVLGAWLRLRLSAMRIALIALRLDASLVLAGVVLRAIVPDDFALGDRISGTALVGVVVAGLAWLATNYALEALEALVRQRTHWRQVLRPIVPYDLIANAALLTLGPSLVSRPGWVIVLLLIPLVAVGQMARLAGERERRARVDPVTGLLGRQAFLSEVEDIRVDRRGQVIDPVRSYALFLLDLDRFKQVNDALGHDVGDQLLFAVARRLASAVRPGDLIARIGGDEFTVVAVGVRDRPGAAAVAGRISRALADPVVLHGLPIDVGYSVGVALFPEDGDDLATVTRHADSAMYDAKRRGGGLAFYNGATARKPEEGVRLLADLRRALDNAAESGLELRYQPQVALGGGVLVGVEATVNWRRSPDESVEAEAILRVAEHTPVMRRLTIWSVDQALDQLAAWQKAGQHIRISVNVSVRDLETTEVADLVADRVRADEVRPELIALEVGESVLTADPDWFRAALTTLAETGILVGLDDFGTGHTSIDDLRRLPLAELKIAPTFVRGMTADTDSQKVVRAIVELGRVLEMRVVATGVETEATHRLLVGLHCPVAQGPYYAEAMTAEALAAWLVRASSRP